MASAKPSAKARITKTPRPSRDEAAERYLYMDSIIREVRGHQLDELESALGMYMIGHHFGWKVLYVIHTKRTIRKYEAILGRPIRELFDEYGPDADRTNAFKLIEAVSSFWKLVSGEEKPSIDVDRRGLHD